MVGTHYNYYRDYDPATGRYLSPDPIGLQGGLNLHGYAQNDALGHSDVLGLLPWYLGVESGQPQSSPASSPAKPAAQSEQSYVDKLTAVFSHAIDELKQTDGQQAAVQFMDGLLENVAVIGAIVVALAASHAAGVGVAADALQDAAAYAGDGLWTLWRKLKRRFGEEQVVAGLCSFAGETLVRFRCHS